MKPDFDDFDCLLDPARRAYRLLPAWFRESTLWVRLELPNSQHQEACREQSAIEVARSGRGRSTRLAPIPR